MSDSFDAAAERLWNVLERTFRGIHHCGKINKFNEGTPDEMWETNKYGGLATFDGDELTRLAIAGHDECVRVEVASSGPRMIKIRLWPRFKRYGNFYEKHPTIEEAIERYRQCTAG